MAYADDIYGDAIGREITVLIMDGESRIVAGVLIDIDGDTLKIHDFGPRPGFPAEHVCARDLCVQEINSTDVCEAIMGAPGLVTGATPHR